jgi:hypothetical protein
VEIPADSIRTIEVTHAALDPLRPSVPVPCLRLTLGDGTSHLLLGGHHPVELEWAASALIEAAGIRPLATSQSLSDAGAGAAV